MLLFFLGKYDRTHYKDDRYSLIILRVACNKAILSKLWEQDPLTQDDGLKYMLWGKWLIR